MGMRNINLPDNGGALRRADCGAAWQTSGVKQLKLFILDFFCWQTKPPLQQQARGGAESGVVRGGFVCGVIPPRCLPAASVEP